MDEVHDPVSARGQNLNDLQNYLVTFNKEIESNEDEGDGFQVGLVTPVTTGGETVYIEVQGEQSQESATENDTPRQTDDAQITSSLFTQPVLSDAVGEGLSGDVPTYVIAQSSDGIEQAVEDDESNTVCIIKTGSVKNFEPPVQLSSVHAQIAQLSGQKIEDVSENSIVSAAEGPETVADHIDQETMDLEDVIRVSVAEDAIGQTCQDEQQIVSVVDAEGLQFTDPESQSLLPQTAKLLIPADDEDEQTVDVSHHLVSQPGDVDIIDGTNPVAVLASVAANTSSVVNHLQTVQVGHSELHNAQLVALQSSSDSSQPQLVAVQASEDGDPDTLQIMNTVETSNPDQNSFVLSNGGTYQTVTIMPSGSGQGNDMSYVLIMSNPDGDKEGGTKQIALDMSNVYDFKEEGQEIVEEIIEENGTTKRVVKITPRKLIAGTGEFNSPLMCTFCNYTSPKRYLLTRHMKTHSEDRPHKCNICGRGFKTQASLQNHINTHTGTRPHHCKECESAFTTSGELVRHMRYRHTFEKPHKCNECDYASVELSKLKRHMRSHTGERPYQCPHCTYASPDTYKLKRHLRIHTGEKPYECDVCHARFTQSNSLKAHKLIHTGNKPVYQCNVCPTTCGRKTDLKIHFQKLHSSEKPLECKKCDKIFPDRYTYKLHIKTHEGEKCFKCDQCDYAALSNRHLESHFLTHTGEKPFQCDACEMTFRQKQLLKRHRNLYHTPDYVGPDTKDKPHDCMECDRSFTHKGNLQRHLVAHDTDMQERIVGDVQTESTAEQLLQNSLLTDLREGKLGNSPKVVIVHPDGRVEEVTAKLQSMNREKPEEQMLVMDLDDMTATNKGAVTAVTATTDSDIQAVVHTVVDNTKASQVTEGEEGKGVVGSDDQTKEAGTQAAFESESESEEEEGQEEEGRALEKEPMHIEVIIPEANLSEAAEIIYSSEASVSGANEFSTHAVIDSCTGTTTLTIPASMLSNLGAVLEQDPTSKDLMKVEVLPSPAKRPRLHE